MNRSTAQAARRLPALLFALALVAAAVLTCANSPRSDPTPQAPGTTTSTAPAFACTVAPEGACMLPALSSEPAEYTWHDGFDREWLQPLWHWVRENAEEWTLSARPGFLRLLAGTGDIWWAHNDQQNLLLQPAPSGDFELTTRVEFSPRFNFEHAGLLVYQDDDNYVHISRVRVTQQKVNFDLEVDGEAINTFALCSQNMVFLRIAREGNTYTGSYSLDGAAWTPVERYTTTLHQPRVGILAGNRTSGLRPDPADFDSFELRAQMPGFDLCTVDEFDGEELDAHWTVQNENPQAWSLTERPGFLRIHTHGGDPGDENLLVQPAPPGDGLIETTLWFTPTANSQSAGLVVYSDAGHWLTLGRRFCDPGAPHCPGDGVYFERVESGVPVGDNYPHRPLDSGEVHLRLWRQDDSYSAFYRQDEAQWTLLGRHTVAGSANLLGISAWGDEAGTAIPADFERFVICASESQATETPSPTPTVTASATATPTVTPQSTAAATATHTIVPTAPTALRMLYLPVLWRGR